MKNRFKIFTTILSALACFGLFSRAQAQEGDVGNGNTVEGFNALNNGSAGAFNTALGWFSLGFNDVFSPAGLGNTGVGAGTLDVAGGNFGTAAGAGALLLNFSASDNTAVGFEALLNNDVTFASLAVDNTAVGFQAMFSNNNGANNTAVGSGALFNSDVSLLGLANGNTAVGSGALTTNSDGSANTAVGNAALLANFDGEGSTAVGSGAGLFSLADETTAVGLLALGVGVNIGDHNTALGSFALFLNGSGSENTARSKTTLAAPATPQSGGRRLGMRMSAPPKRPWAPTRCCFPMARLAPLTTQRSVAGRWRVPSAALVTQPWEILPGLS